MTRDEALKLIPGSDWVADDLRGLYGPVVRRSPPDAAETISIAWRGLFEKEAETIRLADPRLANIRRIQ